MSGQALTTTSVLQCPHGGTVQISSTNTKVTTNGMTLALATDIYTISGCPFQIPVGTGTVPSPCVKVQWIVTDLKSNVNGIPTVSTTSTGLCLAATQAPQGPVSIVSTQPTVSTQ
ncbi:hypothetical protein [Aliikangiella coralliicola]|uniref:DUF4280 domain-containing protein n=1 Tax=Aliikangiella coralliicola TaxID=2592383 RepID=A0A545UE61_9GAMM|nr:hypothetical protein [Aliikangiella coralliicola]TQV87762.1 hypothetical protein FLL46_10270 [Aliikangiella coralliicola]